MIAALALLQLPLLVLAPVLIGLGLYGASFDSAPDFLYVSMIVGLPMLARLSAGRLAPGGRVLRLLLLVGILLAACAYAPLHLQPWERHSLVQALQIAALGVVSALACGAGAHTLGALSRPARARALVSALFVLGAFWLAACAYPFVTLFGTAVVFALMTVVPAAKTNVESGAPTGVGPWAHVVLLLAMLDLSLVLWDLDFSPRWGVHFALAFAAAGIGVVLSNATGGRGRSWLVALFGASFALAALVPSYLLHPVHSILAGMALGTAMYGLIAGGDPRRFALTGSLLLVQGMGIGLVLARNLDAGGWRVLLVLVLVPLLRTRSVGRSPAQPA